MTPPYAKNETYPISPGVSNVSGEDGVRFPKLAFFAKLDNRVFQHADSKGDVGGWESVEE
jgi:hypothetical protein